MPKKAASSVGKRKRKHNDEVENKPAKKQVETTNSVKKVKKIASAKGKQAASPSPKNERGDILKMYSKLLSTFSSRDHLIIGRDKEEKQILKHLKLNMSKNQSSMVYVCGQPGQGKTAVVD